MIPCSPGAKLPSLSPFVAWTMKRWASKRGGGTLGKKRVRVSGSRAGVELQAESGASDPAEAPLAVAPAPAGESADSVAQVPEESLAVVPAEESAPGAGQVPEESLAVVEAEEVLAVAPVPAEASLDGGAPEVAEESLVVEPDLVAEPLESEAQVPASSSPEQARLAEARRRVEELPADGSIRVVFQPIVDLATRKVIGYEALARFPGDSSVSPRTWFAEAAEVGLLLQIEMTAIRAALAHLERLPAEAFISVNLSPETAGSDELRDVLVER